MILRSWGRLVMVGGFSVAAASLATSCGSMIRNEMLAAARRGAAEPRVYLAELSAELAKAWPTNRTVNIVCHGHSVPAGYFRTPLVRTFDAYPHLLWQELKRRYPYAVVNVMVTAIGGENSEEGAARFSRDVLALRPDLVTIDYALNDRAIGLARAERAWRSMIEEARTQGVKVLLMTPTPDMGTALAGQEQAQALFRPDGALGEQAAQVRRLAAEYHVGLVDSFGRFERFVQEGGRIETVMAQGNHPNRKGHLMVAEEMAKWFP